MMDISPLLPASVLFMCHLNAVRSPMAEGLLRRLSQGQIYVQSCGLSSGPLDDLMVAVMAEKAIDMTAHEPQGLRDLQDSSFDLIITFTDTAHAAAATAFEGQDVVIKTWPIPEPVTGHLNIGHVMTNYRIVRDQIETQINGHFAL